MARIPNSQCRIFNYAAFFLLPRAGAFFARAAVFFLARFLTDVAHFPNTPPLLGWMALEDSHGGVTPLAIVHGFVRNQGDGWAWTLDFLARAIEEIAVTGEAGQGEADAFANYTRFASAIGQTIASKVDVNNYRHYLDDLLFTHNGMNRGIGGALTGPSSYFMKSPPQQFTDEDSLMVP